MLQSLTERVLKTLLIIWILGCILFYSFFSASNSYIHSVNFFNLTFYIEDLKFLVAVDFWLQLLLALAGASIFSIAYLSLGAFITNNFFRIELGNKQANLLSKLATSTTQFIIGHSLYSIAFIVLASRYELAAFHVLAMISIGLVLSIKHLKIPKRDNWLQILPKEKMGRAFFWLAIVLLVATLLLSSARISYDSSAIYLSNAKITAENEQIKYFTGDAFLTSAFQSTIHFTALILVFGDQSARIFSWICGLAILIFSVAIGETFGASKTAKTIHVILILTSTAFLDLLGDGKVDLISTAPAMGAIYWLILWKQEKGEHNPKLLLMIGCLAGFSISARPYNAFLLGIFVVLYLTWHGLTTQGTASSRFSAFLKHLTWVGIGVIVIGLIHLGENILIQGNPLAFLNSISKINAETGPWDNDPDIMMTLRLLYPFAATFRNTPQSLGNISPLVIGFVPAVLISAVRKNTTISRELKAVTAIAIITIILWISIFFTIVEIRYVLFVWILIFLPVAGVITSVINDTDRIFKTLASGSIFALLLFFIIRTFLISTVAYSPIDKQGNPQCSNFILCDFLKDINRSADQGERVLTLNAFRYYLRTDLFACSTSNTEYSVLQDLSRRSNELFWEEVYRLGYKYIAYEKEYTTRHLQLGFIPSPDNTPDWIRLERIDQYETDIVAAYKIHVDQPPTNVEYQCRLNSNDIWKVLPIP